MSADTVTVLRAHDERRLAKSFTTATNGVVTSRAYDSAVWFTAEPRPVDGIHSLHRLLVELEGDPFAGVIRGALAEGVDPRRVRRKKTGEGAPFIETPRHWAQLDVDGIPLPAGTSILADPADAARVVLDIVTAHAPELEGVTAVVQFSSSAALNELAEAEEAAGLPPRWQGVAKPGVSAHVWFWLQAPVGEAELNRWFKQVNERAGTKLLDPALARTVQPHYTARPIFGGGLRDPLAGRRTLLIQGMEDAAALVIPAHAPRTYSADAAGGSASTGPGYEGHLDAIGGPDGFREPILKAVSAFIATNWPAPDLTTLKADIRHRIEAADAGGRPASQLEAYASDRHLNEMIAWVRHREGEKRAALAQERRAPDVPPTFPDRGVTLDAGGDKADAAITAFAAQVAKGEAPELLLQVTVGAGKSEAAIRNAPLLLDAARAAGREGAVYYMIPRHNLGDELRERFAQAHPDMKVATWRGMDADDPARPGAEMCLDPELPKAAAFAGLPHTEPCSACPLREECGYRKQNGKAADLWLIAHNAGFLSKPAGLPDAAVTVWDESWWQTGLAGADKPIELPVGDLLDDRTGPVTGLERQRLLDLRRRVHDALEGHEAGGLLRSVFADAGLTAESADEWQKLEWQTKPKVNLDGAADRSDIMERLRVAQGAGFNRKRALLAKYLRDLLEGDTPRSINAQMAPGGGDIRFAWREDFAAWVADAPKLFLDATTAPELVRVWAPRLTVEDIEVSAPHQHVRQIVGGEFGRSKFVQNGNNVRRLADLVVIELAEAKGDVLVIAQEAVKELLRTELLHRFGGAMPARLHLAHHGALTGLDAWRNAERVLVAGRPAVNRRAGERLAEIITGQPVGVVADDEESRWPTVTGGIRMADGTARGVRQPRHPDATVEAVRWSISEGAVLQAIGRGRGVQRTATRPLGVTLLGELALPLTVANVEEWDEAQPDRLTVAAAEAVLAGGALPLAPLDLAMARSDLFPSAKAVERFFERAGNTPQALIGNIYKRLGGIIPCRYRKQGSRGVASHALVPIEAPREALEAAVGALSFFEMEMPAAPPVAAPAAPMEPPAPQPAEMLARITEPPLAGLWTVRGAKWNAAIAADSSAVVALWRPRDDVDAGIPPPVILPPLHAPSPVAKAPPVRIAVAPDLDLGPPEIAAPWAISTPCRDTLSRITT
jgi:putative DNA primase/helicase